MPFHLSKPALGSLWPALSVYFTSFCLSLSQAQKPHVSIRMQSTWEPQKKGRPSIHSLFLSLVLQEECTKTQMNNLDFFFSKEKVWRSRRKSCYKTCMRYTRPQSDCWYEELILSLKHGRTTWKRCRKLFISFWLSDNPITGMRWDRSSTLFQWQRYYGQSNTNSALIRIRPINRD